MNEHAITGYANDLIALCTAIAIIGAYHVYLRFLSRRDNSAVLSAVARHARERWVESMMRHKNTEILAIQTLRNSTMAATFLASTAVLLMVGVMTISAQSSDLKETWHALNITGSLRPEMWLLKLLSMLLVLFFAFFSFTNAIRIFNIVGYTINVRDSETDTQAAISTVSDELNRGGKYFSNGMRAYYYLIPLVCWLFGPLYMVGAAILLTTIMLPFVDLVRKPKKPSKTCEI